MPLNRKNMRQLGALERRVKDVQLYRRMIGQLEIEKANRIHSAKEELRTMERQLHACINKRQNPPKAASALERLKFVNDIDQEIDHHNADLVNINLFLRETVNQIFDKRRENLERAQDLALSECRILRSKLIERGIPIKEIEVIFSSMRITWDDPEAVRPLQTH